MREEPVAPIPDAEIGTLSARKIASGSVLRSRPGQIQDRKYPADRAAEAADDSDQRAAAQGASLAIEDAVALADCLRTRPDVCRALDAFKPIRRAPTEEAVAASARVSRDATHGPRASIR